MVSYDISKVWSFLPTLVQALPATLALMVLTTLLGSAFGLVLTWAQVSEDKVGAGLAKGYVFTLRCTPPIVLLFLVFYGLPQFLNWCWALTLTTGPSLSLSLLPCFFSLPL